VITQGLSVPKDVGGKLKQSSTLGERMQPRFLLMSDVAEQLNVSMSQVYHMVRSGELPAIKIGGRGQWRIERAKLEEYIEQKYAETAQWVKANPLIGKDDEEP
jgi:excisionase family DNA binding protein